MLIPKFTPMFLTNLRWLVLWMDEDILRGLRTNGDGHSVTPVAVVVDIVVIDHPCWIRISSTVCIMGHLEKLKRLDGTVLVGQTALRRLFS